MRRIWNRLGTRALAAAALLTLATAAAHASYITGALNSGADGVVCGSVNEPFGPCPGNPYAGPVQLEIGSAKVQTDFGLNRVLASAGAQAHSEWMVRYGLTGAQPGTAINLTVELAFDLNIAAAIDSQSEFRMVLNNESLSPFIIRIATNGLGNRCDHLALASDCVSGDHSGTWSQNVTASVDPNNRFYLLVGASNFGGGWVDAYNTVRVNRVIVPDGIAWNYADGLQGNPLNFVNVSAVPDAKPAAVFMLGLAAIAGLVRRRRCAVDG